ncbi:hypothetical protein [Bradyrhizobium retamae]|uniref:Uncharacterized protein n=1 Tax=Bradyrhizobium retamae TaxID=1300035 RepID=A0A0R3MRT7_9BRAD|nr:hypothetical protein [Bradyrhizobium retamae]KRR22444.1 hypothetical protein CQ13_28850 [Bradyrhizobium retamae]
MQSTPTLKEADPHDVFAIETVLAAHAHKAPPLAHDPATSPVAPHVHPVAPQVHVAPQAEVAAKPQVQAAAKPQVHVAPAISISAPTAQVEPTFRATDMRDVQMRDVQADNIRPGEEINLDGLNAASERPMAKWTKRVVMALVALVGAIGAAAWQHYGDQAKAMAAEWAPPFVLAALPSAAKPAVAEQPSAPAAPDQAAAEPAAPAQPEPTATVAAAPSAESTQLQSMAQDLAAMGQQVEELKATIAQLKAGQAQMAREFAKATDKAAEMKASEARAAEVRPEQNFRPRVTAAPPPRSANAPVAPVRKPKPAYYPPAQATYVSPPPAAAPAPLPPAPPQQTMADDGEPVVRPPMPLR